MLREIVLNRIIELVSEQYVFADKARELVELMRTNTLEYATAKTDHQFAAMITRDMARVTNDLHLYLEKKASSGLWQEQLPLLSASFFDEGIAYIKINRFPSTNSAKGEEVIREIDHAFLMAAEAKSLIIDIRENKGCDGTSVALATTYLLPPKPQLLVVYHYRSDHKQVESWTLEKLPQETNGPFRPLAGKPLCILVSSNTFSAAEEFAYTLQQMKRATIIGEKTRGGAHPSKQHVIDGTFVLSLPFAETISPITNGNWEHEGITPNIVCPKKDALKIAKTHLIARFMPSIAKNQSASKPKTEKEKERGIYKLN